MVATDGFCFWLADFFKSSPLKSLSQMNRNLVGSNYGGSSIKIAHFIPIPQTEHKYDLSHISWKDSSTAFTLIGFICNVNLIYTVADTSKWMLNVKDTHTSVWSSQYNINVAIKLSEVYTNKMRIIARLKHKMFWCLIPYNL
jgi:hypothetical protein